MKMIAALSLLAIMCISSASAHAEATFRINAPTKADTIIHTPRESLWAKEDKNPVEDFFASLFITNPAPVIETSAAEINQQHNEQRERQHIASVDLSDK